MSDQQVQLPNTQEPFKARYGRFDVFALQINHELTRYCIKTRNYNLLANDICNLVLHCADQYSAIKVAKTLNALIINIEVLPYTEPARD